MSEYLPEGHLSGGVVLHPRGGDADVVLTVHAGRHAAQHFLELRDGLFEVAGPVGGHAFCEHFG